MPKICCFGNPPDVPGIEVASSPDQAECLAFFCPDPAESVRLAAEAAHRHGRPALAVAPGAVTYATWLAAEAAGVPVVASAAVAEKAAALAEEWEARNSAAGMPANGAAGAGSGAEVPECEAACPEDNWRENPARAAAGPTEDGTPHGAPEDGEPSVQPAFSPQPGAEDTPRTGPAGDAGPGQDGAAAEKTYPTAPAAAAERAAASGSGAASAQPAGPAPESGEDPFPRVRAETPSRRAYAAARPFPNVVGSFSPAGGVGKTFMATNTASWAAKLGVKTLLVDADLGYGDAASALFLGEAAREAVRPTVATWRGWPDLEKSLLRTPWGLYVLPRPEDPAAEASLGPGEAADLLSWSAGAFELVVVDFGVAANLPFTRAAMERCGLVFLVVDPTMKSVAKVTSFLEGEAAEAGVRERSYLVVNRIVPASRYRAADLARIFGFQEHAAVPEDAKGANRAAKKRMPLALLGKGKACQEVRRVAEGIMLAGTGLYAKAAAPAPGRKGAGRKIFGWGR